MFNFFYDSLETLKQVKKPSRKEVITLTIQIFIIVIISGIFFMVTDGLLSSLYQLFYKIMQ